MIDQYLQELAVVRMGQLVRLQSFVDTGGLIGRLAKVRFEGRDGRLMGGGEGDGMAR